MPSSENPFAQKCELCGSKDVKFLFTAKDRNREVDQAEFRISRCLGCGVGFTEPKLSGEELARYYPL